ncbi:hypothetical protein K431DRAFT_275674 [Polychaeton citri CBS 116435]|uniref:F-box domain-containing protein n=1 Tax=Polychaeton citri CBS 116435 TaxID=1314669 RepID=A0A9P4PZW4_9PEZI|nr:hypothetical protein K431DRAFT_275674 [Polychaeton citri CBS 116435]
MASQSTLLSLSVEVFEMVVGQLDFGDICNLRLAAYELAAKASQGRFKTYFFAKDVCLSRKHLQDFDRITQCDWMGCGLQELTIIGLVPLADNRPHESHEEESLDLLGKSLANLRANSRHGCLRSLALTVKCCTENGTLVLPSQAHGWHSIWECAGETAHLVALAVKQSSIIVEKLDLYGTVKRCALSSRRLGSLIDLLEMHRLKSLLLTVSANEERDTLENGAEPSENISRLVGSFPELEHLELRWFNLYHTNLSEIELEGQKSFNRIAESSIPLLNSISLRGIHTSTEALLTFLTRHPRIRHLSFEELHLKQGRFRPVFAYIDEHLELDSLYLSDLWESTLIQFMGTSGESYFSQSGPPTWMNRVGAEAREAIVYRPFKGPIKGSAAASNWYRRKAALYGPP